MTVADSYSSTWLSSRMEQAKDPANVNSHRIFCTVNCLCIVTMVRLLQV